MSSTFTFPPCVPLPFRERQKERFQHGRLRNRQIHFANAETTASTTKLSHLCNGFATAC